jgi:hypothetical protein
VGKAHTASGQERVSIGQRQEIAETIHGRIAPDDRALRPVLG